MMAAARSSRVHRDAADICAAGCRRTPPLAPFTWFRAGGPAEVLVRPADVDDLAQFLRATAARCAGARDRRVLPT